MDNLIILVFGTIMLIGNLAGGYHLDEQVNYPHDNRHSKVISKKVLRYFLFKNKKRRYGYLRASYILEVAGYIEFFISLITTVVFITFNYNPNNNILLFTVFIPLGVNEVFLIVTYTYYKIKHKQ